MPVQSIECTLTQAQMKRYLAGTEFSDELIGALERHLRVCPLCMTAANEQREALGGAPMSLAQAVVTTQDRPAPFSKLKKLLAKPRTEVPASLLGNVGENPYADPLAAIKSPKNLLLSGTLAIVLILMSTVLRNPTALFGPRAAATISPATSSTVAEDTKTAPPDVDKSPPKPDKVAAKEEVPAVAMHTTSKEPDTVATKTSPEPAQPVESPAKSETKPTVPAKKTELDKLGGTVLVAESAGGSTKAAVEKNHPAQKAVRRAFKAPTRRRPYVRPRSASHPKTGVRVYLPDGTVKPH